MRAGEMRQVVEVQTNTPVKDSFGGVTNSWATTSTVRAKVINHGTGLIPVVIASRPIMQQRDPMSIMVKQAIS